MSTGSSTSLPWDDFQYRALNEDLLPGQRWSTWTAVQRLCRGPQPRPDWLVTSQAAIDTDLGVLKTGKEADVHLLERAVPDDPDQACLLAAKRYRDPDNRLFHRDTVYTEGRRVRNTRDTRAMRRKSEHGRAVQAGLWAAAEWTALNQLYLAGIPVPYPVQVDGTEILMQYLTDSTGTAAAPRLAQYRPTQAELPDLWDQLRQAICNLAALGLAHGDLSPYNVLVSATAGNPRLVIIDVPQVVDIVANPAGVELLQRDCTNMTRWFSAAGYPVDAEALLAEALAHAW